MNIVKSIAATALALTTAAAVAHGNQEPIRVVVDGEAIQFNGQQPVEENGRVLVPLRGVFQRLGARVNWDPSSQTITARKNGTHVQLTIGERDASIDGRDHRMDVAAMLDSGVTMVPLRFVSEALGAFVHWDADNHEVDIKSTTDYNLPRPRPTPPPPVPTPPPPPPKVIIREVPVPVKQEARPLRIVRNYEEVRANTVIPLVLDTRLSSHSSKAGDLFTATVETRGESHYMNVPRGTRVYGSVAYVKSQHRRQPGLIELRFDHMILPNGRTLPLNGSLIGLNDSSVMRRDNGEIVAASDGAGVTNVLVATGTNSAMVVALPTKRPLQDGMINGLLFSSVDKEPRLRLARDMELDRGTTFGLRLNDSLIIPHDAP